MSDEHQHHDHPHDHPHDQHRLDDAEAHERALDLLAEVAGAACCEHVCWDPDHHLQGHIEVGGEHLVVIAPRDASHEPLVLTERDWDALRTGCLTAGEREHLRARHATPV